MLILAPNWLGDAVMALPAIADVRRAYPAAPITVAARPAVAPLFALVPGVTDTIVLDPDARALRAWTGSPIELRERRFDIALLLPNSFHAALLASRAGVPERWGYRTDWRSRLLTRAVDRPKGVHQAVYYQHLTSALGMAAGLLTPRIEVPDSARAAATEMLAAAGWNRRAPVVALAPGAAYGGAKRWPPDYFAGLVRGLAEDAVTIAMVGSGADRATGAEIEEGLGRSATLVNLIGRTDLATLAGVLAIARAAVSNDSGAMHLAAAIGVPVTAIFGPTDEKATAPLSATRSIRLTPNDENGEDLDSDGLPTAVATTPNVVLTNPVWCRPCMLRECPLDHRCMRGVSVERVLDATRRVL